MDYREKIPGRTGSDRLQGFDHIDAAPGTVAADRMMPGMTFALGPATLAGGCADSGNGFEMRASAIGERTCRLAQGDGIANRLGTMGKGHIAGSEDIEAMLKTSLADSHTMIESLYQLFLSRRNARGPGALAMMGMALFFLRAGECRKAASRERHASGCRQYVTP
ncbi:MAG: hypothetical protein Kow00104_08160 [Rhodothalassiaceae bacterium]